MLKPIWRDSNISLGSKVNLIRSLVISIFLYACKSWTLAAELEKRTQAFERKCYRRLMNISYKDHVQDTEAKVVWPCFKVFWFSKDNPKGHSERKKKKRQTEEEVGRQYQRVDKDGLCQLI